MDNRLLAWLVLSASGLYSGMMLMESVSEGFVANLGRTVWIAGMLGAAGGMRLLWSTGLYRHSPLWRFQYFAIVFLILSYMMRIMHWPYVYVCMLLAIGSMLAIYGVHFVLKPRKALRDILRLLVVVLAGCMFGLTYIHFIPSQQALWIVLGIVSIAMVEFLFHPGNAMDPPASAPTETRKPDPTDLADGGLADEHPELFQ